MNKLHLSICYIQGTGSGPSHQQVHSLLACSLSRVQGWAHSLLACSLFCVQSLGTQSAGVLPGPRPVAGLTVCWRVPCPMSRGWAHSVLTCSLSCLSCIHRLFCSSGFFFASVYVMALGLQVLAMWQDQDLFILVVLFSMKSV